ncbi:DUF3817 domain-containing protein [uncultured Tenacibaculum sp.]|uniref:DUF3817 domain-containing protein n=1 Tax=uncultured Tenacibaculum sp. TaxID=174713 RepID=UPI00262CE544|nr:DUF3817 domain-containing protein [uncultured Tenacibaculum sp.]
MINIFKIVSFLEGLSYILLLFIATPIKYIYDDPTYVKWLGMPHGLLFIGYLALATLLKVELKWSVKDFLIVCLLAIIPFGTFFVGKYLKEEKK